VRPSARAEPPPRSATTRAPQACEPTCGGRLERAVRQSTHRVSRPSHISEVTKIKNNSFCGTFTS